ncbi:MAG: hypothetical protein ACKO5F_14095 [Synechococcus sp.]
MTIPLLHHIPPGTALIHIGAHHGQEAPAYAAHNAPVLWIEACPLFIPRLQQQLVNHPQQQCRLGAVAARAGQRRVFHLSNTMQGVSSSFFHFGAGAQELWPELQLQHIQTTMVTTTTLDNLIEQDSDWINQHNPTALVIDNTSYDLVIAYGILYHLDDPLPLLRAVAAIKPRHFLLETCVTPELSTQSSGYPLCRCSEQASDGSQSVTGVGCRPDRRWLWKTLQSLFQYVYSYTHQPDHPEFPLNWEADGIGNISGLSRMIFLCSNESISSKLVTESLPMRQQPCKPVA